MEDLESKQNYLREEIIEKGFSPENFTDFVSTLRDDGSFDLESWSMKDLVQIVNYYKEQSLKASSQDNQGNQGSDTQTQSQQQPQQQQQQQQQMSNDYPNNEPDPEPQLVSTGLPKENELVETVKQQDQATKNRSPTQCSPSILYDKENSIADYNETLPCIKSDHTLLTEYKELSIEVSKPELVKPGIFSTQYYQFTLTIKEINKSVVRKLTDFEWFYHKLIVFYPGISIPHLQVQRVFEKKTEKEMTKKLFYIEQFINSLAKITVIRSGQFFLDFVSLPPQAWSKTMSELKANEGPTSINKFITMSGEINITISKDLDEKARSMERDVKLKTTCYTRITTALDKLMAEMEVMSNCLAEVSNAFKEMSRIYNESPFKNEYMETGYAKFGTAMNEWSESYKKQGHFVHYEIRFFLKFVSKEINYLTKHFDIFKAARGKYLDYCAKMAKWISPTIQQTGELNQLRRMYGYYLTRLLKEMKRLNKNQSKRFKAQFEVITERKKELIADQVAFQKMLEFVY